MLNVNTAYVIDNLLCTRHEMCEEVPGLSMRFHDTVYPLYISHQLSHMSDVFCVYL